MMSVKELTAKITMMTKMIAKTSSAYLKEVYTEQRGRYEHEVRRQKRARK